MGLADSVEVQVSPAVPDDRVFVVDHHGLEASANQALTRDLNHWTFSPPTARWRATRGWFR